MDIQMMEQQLKGFESKGKELRAKEAIFIKVQGLKEKIEESRASLTDIEADITDMKERLAELKGEKAVAVSETVSAITEKMNAVLPEGEAVCEINGGVSIGWRIGGVVKPYHGLSGGEKVVFDGALANALGAGLMIYESAECDGSRLIGLLDALSEIDKQVIVNTWSSPVHPIPDKFSVVEV